MKIIFERQKCIGCGSCAVLCPAYWELTADGKSHLKQSAVNPANGNEELEVQEIGCNQEAAESCPVECIKINEK